MVQPQQVGKDFLLHQNTTIKVNSKTITDSINLQEYYMKPITQSIQRKKCIKLCPFHNNTYIFIQNWVYYIHMIFVK